MRVYLVIEIVLCIVSRNFVIALDSEELAEITESCCTHGETFAVSASSIEACSGAGSPDDIELDQMEICLPAAKGCCQRQFREKDDCTAGTKFAKAKRCNSPKSDIGKTCCNECTFGIITGASEGAESCGSPADGDVSPITAFRKNAFYECCMAAAKEAETTTTEKEPETTTEEKVVTTTEKKIETTTEKKIETTTEKKVDSTTQKVSTTTDKKTETTTAKAETTTAKADTTTAKVEITTPKADTTTAKARTTTAKAEITTPKADTTTAKARTSTAKAETTTAKAKTTTAKTETTTPKAETTTKANTGATTEKTKEGGKYINECAESLDDLCTDDDTVCHNTEGSYKCVPIKKREVGLSCPPGFQKNVVNQVCDDINECRLPRPPCPKYLCENTIGGYKCGGKQGKPFVEAGPSAPGAATEASDSPTTPKNDICPPGFRAGVDDECIDIDECEERLDDCQRLSQHCINTHGSYFCQDHVSKRCAPGFKVNSATGICEDIDECEESSEVCKRTEVCVNLPGAYNCKSKISTLPKLATKTCQEGTRVRPGGTICEDIDECREGTHLCDQFQNCINTFGGHECRCKNGFELDSALGSCVDVDECALKLDNCGSGTHCLNVLGSFTCTRRTTTASPTTPPIDEYEYYYSEEEDVSNAGEPVPEVTTASTTSTSTTTTSTTTTPRPTTTSSTTTTSTTTPRPYPPRPRYPYHRTPPTTRRTPYTNRPDRPLPTIPTTSTESVIPLTPRNPVYSPRRPESRPPVVITLPTPRDPVMTIERERNPDGSYDINTDDIPKDRWTNVIGKESPETPDRPDFDLNNLHCLAGYEKNAKGECVDIDECEEGRHICSNLEVCQNRPGGYMCNCIPGFLRDPSGWCVVSTTSSSTPRSTTSPRPATRRTTTTRKPTTTSTTTTTTTTTATPPTTSESSTAASTLPEWTYLPKPRPRPDTWPFSPPINCELGYSYSASQGKCVDIDECVSNKASCSANEDCVNTEGGFRCICGRRCREEHDNTYVPARESPPISTGDSNVITVGAQYGQRGARYVRPARRRLPDTGAVVATCPWGYTLTPEKYCIDTDECARNISECGPQQRCENFYGGYSCQCPTGHRLVGQRCEDVDECLYGNPCSYYARCVNSVGSYHCACNEGFRNAPSNDKVCVDVDECAESSTQCQHGCSNAWGGYRCYCYAGYRLGADNRTCVDIDECAEWSAVRVRGRLCGGSCVNVAGSYRCACPAGYRLADDAHSCIDIDECENGEAQCGRPEEGNVCQNTRGGYHCHHINCPSGYHLEGKHKCTRIQRACPVSDWGCLQQPSTYSYNFITFVSNIYLPLGSVDLFTMHGPAWRDSVVNFEMRMIDVQASRDVRPADLSCFDMRPSGNICVVSLLCSLGGPQVAELELTMSLYQRAQFAGSAVARLVVIVSQYDF